FVGVFLCDVSGHGTRAALVTTMVRALVEELVGHADQPEHFLAQLNRAVFSILGAANVPLFITAFYGVYDHTRQQLHFVNAGHPNPALPRRPRGELLAVAAGPRPGPPLGVVAQPSYVRGSVSLEQGDLLVLYTDGLYEVHSCQREMFGQPRVRA